MWLKVLFEMWLIEDHGLVNKLGHGFFYKPGFDTLISLTRDKKKLNFITLTDAIHFPGTSLPFAVKYVEHSKYGPNVPVNAFHFQKA
jgi:hypothetical protein